jgi:sugar lactone lactonase YvrE
VTRRVGSGEFVYEEVKGWGHFPEEWGYYDVADVGVDSKDRVFVLTRGMHPIIVLDNNGNYLTSWGENLFARPHGLFISPDDIVYCVDDRGHTVHKFTPDGELLMTIETADHPANTGYIFNKPDTVIMSGPPFNRPTGLALSPVGEIYISDGYGNARIHRFTQDGRLLFSWGEPGDGPGQFRIPHDVCIDEEGLVYVADRQNLRIQIFSLEGEYIAQWKEVRWPNAMCIDHEGRMYVAEMGGVFFEWPTIRLDSPQARVTVRDLSGKILAELDEEDPLAKGVWYSPHGIAVDSRGDLYVGEVTKGHTKGMAPPDWRVLRKYIRI